MFLDRRVREIVRCYIEECINNYNRNLTLELELFNLSVIQFLRCKYPWYLYRLKKSKPVYWLVNDTPIDLYQIMVINRFNLEIKEKYYYDK